MKPKHTITKKEFGDFQTPLELSALMVNIINANNIRPDVIVEPTCGIGNVLLTAHNFFNPQKTIGIEINNNYYETLQKKTNGDKKNFYLQ
jgi:type I restriction-modification system DNA methylase subunit